MIPIVRDFSVCPRCGSPTEKATALTGESEFWYECTKCNTFINTYVPQEHQKSVHEDAHKFKGNFGGYGTGKTLTSRQQFYKHVFLTPNGNTLIGANVQSQYEQTLKREIEADMPVAFIQHISLQKQYMDLINGHRVIYRPFDDPDKLRSYNLSMFIILEASECKAETFTQLKTRLRNKAAIIYEKNEDGSVKYRLSKEGVPIPVEKTNWLEGIVESNPAPGWIKKDVLLVADQIYKHGDILDEYYQDLSAKDPVISAHVTATNCNQFLPAGFVESLTKNKPNWWVSRFVYGSFMYSEGLVYPSAMKHVVDYFDIPKHWKRMIAFDYGLSDDAVFLFGAIDQGANLLYIYKELVVNNRDVEQLAALYFEGSKDIPSGGLFHPPLIDPKSAAKRDYNKKSLADHFLEYGIAFEPGAISIDARVYRLNTYFESGKLKIMNNCKYLIKQLEDYKFATKRVAEDGYSDKPEDKNNHAINPLEWIVMALPANPSNLCYGIYNKRGDNIISDAMVAQDRMSYSMWALSDPEEDYSESPLGIADYY